MEKAIQNTLRYFGFFRYAPLKDELWLFLQNKVEKKAFETKLRQMVKAKKLKSLRTDPPRYTLGEYSISGKDMAAKSRRSAGKIGKMRLYIRLLSFFPQIRLVGLSGSVAMHSADPEADVDFFLVTEAQRLWTARFIAIGIAKALGIHRAYDQTHAGNKACLNLFFDEKNLVVPSKKRNIYVAHEVLQMKPQVVKGNSYLIYLDSNRWVFDIFKNAKYLLGEKKTKRPVHTFRLPIIGRAVETILKKIQLTSINRRRTTEIITPTQLWFFPDDFEKRVLGYKISSRKKSK